MQIRFKGTNYELEPDIIELATRKIQSLEKYVGKTGSDPIAYADLGKHTEAHQNGDIWYADCALTLEGKRYYARAVAETLRTALDRMTSELGKELRRDHKKRHSLLRRSGARLKTLFMRPA